MISIFLTSTARACCKLVFALFLMVLFTAQGESSGSGGVNYSRWPKRSELWIQVTELMRQGKAEEARDLLEKESGKTPLTPECEKLLAELKFRDIFSSNGDDKQIYVVKRGDSLTSIARKTKSSMDYIIAINNIMDPGKLTVGQKFVVRPLDMRLEIDVKGKTISLIDKDKVLKVYTVKALRSTNIGTVNTTVRSKTGKSGDGVIAQSSEFYPAADKVVHLRNGMVINGTRNSTAPAPGFYLSQEDCNELALLLAAGNEVKIIH